MRELYQEQLQTLNSSLSKMGDMVQNAIRQSIDAFVMRDCERAREIIKQDEIIDDMEKQIESECLHLLLRQSPVAKDLRSVSAALKMVTDLERIGDHAADISELVLLLGDKEDSVISELVKQMAEQTSTMVYMSLQAYVNQDLQKAENVLTMDDEVDTLFVSVKRKIASEINLDIMNGEHLLDMMMIAKYFERIGDHAENIGEWVVFSITGNHKEERVI